MSLKRQSPSGPITGEGVNESPLTDVAIPANDFGSAPFAVPGSVVGDVVVGAPVSIPAGLIIAYMRVTTPNQAIITFYNITGAPVNTGTSPVRYVLFKQ